MRLFLDTLLGPGDSTDSPTVCSKETISTADWADLLFAPAVSSEFPDLSCLVATSSNADVKPPEQHRLSSQNALASAPFSNNSSQPYQEEMACGRLVSTKAGTSMRCTVTKPPSKLRENQKRFREKRKVIGLPRPLSATRTLQQSCGPIAARQPFDCLRLQQKLQDMDNQIQQLTAELTKLRLEKQRLEVEANSLQKVVHSQETIIQIAQTTQQVTCKTNR